MKPTAVFVLVAVLSLGLVAAGAKTVNAPQSDNDRIAATMSGPDKGTTTASANAAMPGDADAMAQPDKKTLKKSKIQQKPKLQDPN